MCAKMLSSTIDYMNNTMWLGTPSVIPWILLGNMIPCQKKMQNLGQLSSITHTRYSVDIVD